MHRIFMKGNRFLSRRGFWVLGWKGRKFPTSLWSQSLRLRNFFV